MQYFIINEFESKNIILIVEHRQMNILFNAFSVCMIRQLLVTTIPRYNSICSGTNREIHNSSIVTQYFESITRFKYTRSIRTF